MKAMPDKDRIPHNLLNLGNDFLDKYQIIGRAKYSINTTSKTKINFTTQAV